jgi:hypothetical protein
MMRRVHRRQFFSTPQTPQAHNIGVHGTAGVRSWLEAKSCSVPYIKARSAPTRVYTFPPCKRRIRRKIVRWVAGREFCLCARGRSCDERSVGLRRCVRRPCNATPPPARRGAPERLRTLYAFDPRRVAILLIGGDKTGNERWYEFGSGQTVQSGMAAGKQRFLPKNAAAISRRVHTCVYPVAHPRPLSYI